MSQKSEPLALGIDLGGTKILTAVVTSRGEMLSRDHSITPAKQDHETVIRSVLESTERALREAAATIETLDAIGIGVPGLSNPETGILFTSPNIPKLKDVPIREIIEKQLGKRAVLINDANAAALGEFYFGAAKGASNFIYITVSTGIGGGIVIDGKIYTGAIGTAGEVGHMTINDKGPPCKCGNRGCWEVLASGTALAREAKQKIKEGDKTDIMDFASGNIDMVTAEVIYKAAQNGDGLAGRLIRETGYYLGVGLASLINIFNPELVVIGGGLSNIGDMLLEPAIREAKKRAFKTPFQAVRFERARLGRNSGVLGAAAFSLEEINRLNKL